MSQVPYSAKGLIQRIRKHLSNHRNTSDQFSASDNEILLMIDQTRASRMIGQIYNNAKIEGAMAVPEAYFTTFKLPAVTQDDATLFWITTLPQPPMSLPLGYSISRVYPKKTGAGVLDDIHLIKNKRVGRRMSMPMQPGIRGWVEGITLTLAAHDNRPLGDLDWYTQMTTARTSDINAVMTMPEDDIEAVFMGVVKMLAQRYGFPQDIVLDGLPSGNKSS